tara:strand:+ start:42 stop:290 length:249 start_codon:yes stop_codon:yes gene_type:complete
MTSLYGIEPLTGAYGRSYTSVSKAQADFNDDKDFRMASGSYINKSQLLEMGVTTIAFRYDSNRKKDYLKVQTEKQAARGRND